MKNTLTLNGVEIELTPEQAEKLKAGVCGPKTPAEAPPKKLSWEGLGTVDGYFVTSTCNIWWRKDLKADYANRNIWPTKEYAKASLALAQLLQIRKSLIGDWVPDWAEPTVKYIIQANCLGAYRSSTQNVMRSLSFPSKEMADKVLDDCRDLLEIAKPLL